VNTTGLQAVIFDVDGTLADTERLGHRVAYNQAFRDLGADWQWDETLYGQLLRIEGGPERLRHYLREYAPRFEPTEGRAAFIGAAHRRKNIHYHAMLGAGELPLRPGVRRLLHEVRASGLKLAIASSSLRANVHALLVNAFDARAAGWFDAIVTGDDTTRKKPDPEIYQHVLTRLDLPGEACIALEDSENGCRAARAAGLPTLVTVSSYTHEQDFSGSLLVADSLGEPGQPWRILAGQAEGMSHCDLAGLRALHADAVAGPQR
jgi:HAD superfamily hydrolase (TIGR01509 family)